MRLRGNLSADQLAPLARRYDACGVVDTPPAATFDVITGHDVVVCSHLPRSLESAALLGIGEIAHADPLFAETAIPHFDRGTVTLPIGIWVVVLRLFWLLGFSRNGEPLSIAKRRAQQAAERLVVLAEGGKHVVLVGHGLFNYMIARALLRKGWAGPTRPGRDFWEFGVYRYTGSS